MIVEGKRKVHVFVFFVFAHPMIRQPRGTWLIFLEPKCVHLDSHCLIYPTIGILFPSMLLRSYCPVTLSFHAFKKKNGFFYFFLFVLIFQPFFSSFSIEIEKTLTERNCVVANQLCFVDQRVQDSFNILKGPQIKEKEGIVLISSVFTCQFSISLFLYFFYFCKRIRII